ncbi:carboxylating nicotinate-nucleotide diphosphorylase [Pseudoxanthomonas dokdonensis]|uniref:Probable nicotinate-nucleotide pyrophosphorylase [carboxylating] n=1 Tax=Pseudoxanthomonas dokdonensis TaxID=344882 RepID=A0A0R0CI61_9GAMM|nr:carboxylating nicotinate-nucleotide diphosphorylase [Pseudoxanthomonas dokdonensis]KRG69168.1 nicotinate-nucleotide pyrophosphorylase [Pseudoxanthomonas dokdonensis]
MSRPDVQAAPAVDPELVLADVRRALAEDVGSGDVTAALLPDTADVAYLLCKQDAVIAGRPWFDACHRLLDPSVRIDWRVEEGQRVAAGTVLATLQGHSRSLVTAERTALNFIQTLSATATTTAAYVEAVHGTAARILDTRKTLPGLRIAQKYAVRCGGGHNHRIGLYDAVMLKENHIRAAGSLSAATLAARQLHPQLPLIVEVETLAQLREAIDCGCDRILIDDFDPATRREAVRITAGRIPLEVSGSVDLDSVRGIALDGVDCISIGGLTKHVRAIDLSMKLGPPPAMAATQARPDGT